MHKNIKTAKKHKNTCFLNCYKNIKNFFTSMVAGDYICVSHESINAEFVGRRYKTRPGAQVLIS